LREKGEGEKSLLIISTEEGREGKTTPFIRKQRGRNHNPSKRKKENPYTFHPTKGEKKRRHRSIYLRSVKKATQRPREKKENGIIFFEKGEKREGGKRRKPSPPIIGPKEGKKGRRTPLAPKKKGGEKRSFLGGEGGFSTLIRGKGLNRYRRSFFPPIWKEKGLIFSSTPLCDETEAGEKGLIGKRKKRISASEKKKKRSLLPHLKKKKERGGEGGERLPIYRGREKKKRKKWSLCEKGKNRRGTGREEKKRKEKKNFLHHQLLLSGRKEGRGGIFPSK